MCGPLHRSASLRIVFLQVSGSSLQIWPARHPPVSRACLPILSQIVPIDFNFVYNHLYKPALRPSHLALINKVCIFEKKNLFCLLLVNCFKLNYRKILERTIFSFSKCCNFCPSKNKICTYPFVSFKFDLIYKLFYAKNGCFSMSHCTLSGATFYRFYLLQGKKRVNDTVGYLRRVPGKISRTPAGAFLKQNSSCFPFKSSQASLGLFSSSLSLFSPFKFLIVDSKLLKSLKWLEFWIFPIWFYLKCSITSATKRKSRDL